MQLSNEQSQVINEIKCWLQNPSSNRVFVLAGYAGTGKTTLAQYVATDNTCFAAFTGKAAQALKDRGVPQATTIHQLIYKLNIKSKDHLKYLQNQYERETDERKLDDLKHQIVEEKRRLNKPSFMLREPTELGAYDLVVIDEYSMINDNLLQDLLTFDFKILALGDPFQLPPVSGENQLTPDAFLTQVFRNEGSILDAATKIRLGETPEIGDIFNVKQKSETSFEDYDSVEQIIVARNKTRHAINRRMREKRGHTSRLPEPGERIIFKKNQHDEGIYNGSIATINAPTQAYDEELIVDTVEFGLVPVDNSCFGNEEVIFTERGVQNADFAYAITCHKSQGSEFDSVLVYDEGFSYNEEMQQRWLYTAVTRAKNYCEVVKA